jgi:hypothetical protein
MQLLTCEQNTSKFDVRGSVHHSTIHTEKSNRMQQCTKFIIPYLYEAQHVSSDTPSIIRSLKLHWQPLVLHTLKVVGRWGCWTLSASSILNVHKKNTSRLEHNFFPKVVRIIALLPVTNALLCSTQYSHTFDSDVRRNKTQNALLFALQNG